MNRYFFKAPYHRTPGIGPKEPFKGPPPNSILARWFGEGSMTECIQRAAAPGAISKKGVWGLGL